MKSALKQKGRIDNENIFYLEKEGVSILMINLEKVTFGEIDSRSSLVAITKEGLGDYFMYFDTVSGVLNKDGVYTNVKASANFIDSQTYADFKYIKSSSLPSNKFSTESESYCVEEYYMQMEADCNSELVCNITCKIAAPLCAAVWFTTALIRCFWDWYYGVEYFVLNETFIYEKREI